MTVVAAPSVRPGTEVRRCRARQRRSCRCVTAGHRLGYETADALVGLDEVAVGQVGVACRGLPTAVARRTAPRPPGLPRKGRPPLPAAALLAGGARACGRPETGCDWARAQGRRLVRAENCRVVGENCRSIRRSGKRCSRRRTGRARQAAGTGRSAWNARRRESGRSRWSAKRWCSEGQAARQE